MVKALSFKGDPKPKKRKRTHAAASEPQRDKDDGAAQHEHSHEHDGQDWHTADNADEVSGPVLLVFAPAAPVDADEPVLCLAADAAGAVFASPLDNVLASAPDPPSTAEPHDVRQVWVASRVAGAATVNLRAAHGRYLGVERRDGKRLVADAEARGPDEGWVLEAEGKRLRLRVAGGEEQVGVARAASGKWTVQLGAGEADLVVRMQAKFKPKVEAARKEKAYEKISRAQIEREAGRPLEEEEVRRLKRARKDGTYHEEMLDIRSKGKHDKFA